MTFGRPQQRRGAYYYTAHSAGGTAVIPPVLKVVVSNDAPVPAPAAELTALSVASFDSFPNALELAPAFDADVTEYRVPAVKWSSNSWERMFRVKGVGARGGRHLGEPQRRCSEGCDVGRFELDALQRKRPAR